jgi:phosphatidylglycerol:prolipoprotein diacylglycerol transferase
VYPLLFHFGPITLPTAGALAAVALVAGLSLAMHTARRLGLHPDLLWDLGLVTVFSGILGAKLLLIFQDWRDFLHYPLLVLSLSTTHADRARAWGLLLAVLAGWVYLQAKGMPLLRTLDAVAPALALGDAIVQLGAFAAGSGYGSPTTLPWGVVYSNRMAAYGAGAPLGIRLHPTQIYASAVELLLCALLLWLLPRRRQDGEAMGAWLFLNGLATFWLGFLRGAPEQGLFFDGVFSLTQCIAFAMVIAGALLWLERGRPRRQVLHAH